MKETVWESLSTCAKDGSAPQLVSAWHVAFWAWSCVQESCFLRRIISFFLDSSFGLLFSSLPRQVLLALHLQGGRGSAVSGPGLVEGAQLANHPGPASSVMGMRDTLAWRTRTSRDNQDERGPFHHSATRTLRTPWRAREAGSKT